MNLEEEKKYLIDCFEKSRRNKKVSYNKVLKIIQLKGDVSNKKFYRIITDESSYVICLGEVNFLETYQVLREHEISIPNIFDHQNNDYFLIEDLGDTTLCDYYYQSGSEIESFYQNALEELFKFQSISNVPSDICFNYEKLMEEIMITTGSLKDYYQCNPKILKSIELEFDSICKNIVEHKMVLCHRDYHSKNIMIHKEKLYLIDFQDMRYGLPQYDLVSLLEDCYVALEPRLKKKLKERYWKEFLSPRDYQDSQELFEKLYDEMNIQRTFKAIGTFIIVYNKRNDDYFKDLIREGWDRLIKVLDGSGKKNLKENIMRVRDELLNS